MGRIIAVYGVIAGIIVIIGWTVGMTLLPEGGMAGMVAGYISMLVAFTFVFIGVKRYRDTTLGGVIRFWNALWLGLGIAAVAALFYVLSWEIYMWRTGGTFMAEYMASTISDMRKSGASASEIARYSAEMAKFAEQYKNPLFRMLITFSEIAPVGLLVSLISAALLRNTGFMPGKVGGS
jgi:Protein of unknown function (DUF4199)